MKSYENIPRMSKSPSIAIEESRSSTRRARKTVKMTVASLTALFRPLVADVALLMTSQLDLIKQSRQRETAVGRVLLFEDMTFADDEVILYDVTKALDDLQR